MLGQLQLGKLVVEQLEIGTGFGNLIIGNAETHNNYLHLPIQPEIIYIYYL